VENGNHDDHPLAVIVGSDFQNGVIRTEIAGARRPDAPPDMRGFVGIAFRIRPSASHFECFFLRPDNGRAEDQLRRNHSTQYVSHPDYPWDRLRAENPGVYESYADLASGAWTSVKIVVSGVRAALFVNNAEQPCLIVNDLKLVSRVARSACGSEQAPRHTSQKSSSRASTPDPAARQVRSDRPPVSGGELDRPHQ
jgi:hypothetical protein